MKTFQRSLLALLAVTFLCATAMAGTPAPAITTSTGRSARASFSQPKQEGMRMNTMEAILTRRSIRKFTDQPVSDDVVRQLLEAAMSAPSAGNEQPWHFVVIREREILDAVPGFHPYAGMIKYASLAILVCGDTTLEKYQGFWVQDCSATTQNILLAAHELGLGAVWTGIYPVEERVQGMRKLLGLPGHVIPLSLVPIGYPAQKAGREDRFREERVHYNRYLGKSV